MLTLVYKFAVGHSDHAVGIFKVSCGCQKPFSAEIDCDFFNLVGSRERSKAIGCGLSCFCGFAECSEVRETSGKYFDIVCSIVAGPIDGDFLVTGRSR